MSEKSKNGSTKHVNVFSTPEFVEHDFREDLQIIPEVSELKPVGREKWNYRDYYLVGDCGWVK